MGKNTALHVYLRELRQQAALAQDQVAKELGYESSQFVSNWERGISHPPLKALRKLAQIYKVPVAELYQHVERAILEDLKSSLRKRFRQIQD